MKVKNLILIISIITLSCKDEFLLVNENYVPRVVVEGIISNEPPPYTIELSITSPLINIQKIPLENCIVTLIETNGEKEQLTEKEPGIYFTAPDGIQAIIGNEYSISITTSNGIKYQSTPQKMAEPVGIDSVYAKLIYLEDENYRFPGYQFYVNSEVAPNKDNYFLWKMTETFQYTANYIISDLLNPEEEDLQYYRDKYRCWKTQNANYFFTGKTTNLITPQISNQPLHFVGTDTKRLQERYSLLLNQYSIGLEAYNFWKSAEDQFSQGNFLFAYQPYDIIGNVKNVDNPNEEVFGYITVASVTKKRIFIDRPRVGFYYDAGCSMSYDLNELYQRSTTVFLVQTNDGSTAGVSEWCINCELEGGISNKPDFWVDK